MWYQGAVCYEIYVPSFCDSNQDGIGDINGIISKLPYLKDLGIKGIWLTPFYPSPRVDNGYDISNYREVDPQFGTLDQLISLIELAHQMGMRVIIDMVINHTSNQHPWFIESKKSKDNPYRDYYIWEPVISNNWESFFAGSAWEYDETTKEYYYHAFSKEQVCLNYSYPKVRDEIFDILRYWLELGVDGFRFDVINFLKMQRNHLPDNPMDGETQIHRYDKNQEGIFEFIEEIKDFCSQWPDKFLLGEVGEDALEDMLPYVGEKRLDAVFNFNIGSMEEFDVTKLWKELLDCEAHGLVPTLFFSTHDMRRHISRLCNGSKEMAKLLLFLMMTLKGIPFLYQGEEQAVVDFCPSNIEEIQDIQGKLWYSNAVLQGKSKEEAFSLAYKNTRDFSRKLLTWDENLEEEFLLFYKNIIRFRNEHEVLQYGEYNFIKLEDSILSYQRSYEGQAIHVLLNFGDVEVPLNQNKDYVISTQKGTKTLKPYQGVAYFNM